MRRRSFIALVLAGMLSLPALAGEVSARWELESSQAAIGQTLTLTLEIEGTDQFDPPRLTVPGVEITFQGGGPHNSSSIVSVNGKTTRTNRKSWVGSWGLKSGAVGQYHLDAQSMDAGGQTVFLPALNWQVTPAQTDQRFVLQQRLSQDVCIPGIEIVYTLTWYIGQSVQNPEFTLPILDNPDLVPVESSFSGAVGDTFQIEYNGRVLTGVKSVGQLDGRQYTTLTISFKVKPAKSGRYDLSGTLVSFKGAVDSRQSEDLFGNIVNEPVYRSLVAGADPLTLTVKELPAAGKPSPFSGLIGKLDLAWEAVSGAYHVGEPIRVKLTLSGVLNKPDLDLDHMVITALSNDDFQVSPDLAAKAEDGSRSFIFRARRAGKLTVPAMKLNYYDPKNERYGETSTKQLTFEITGSANGADNSSSTAGIMVDHGSHSAGTDDAPGGLAMMNPSGVGLFRWPAVPWWAFALPGLVSGLIISALAWWRHSPRRVLARERKAWRVSLAPLAADSGRASLEEGRLRLQRLTSPGDRWREKLASDGRWEYLTKQIQLWDEAFFDDNRDGEPWKARWDELRNAMEAWK